MLVKNSTKLNIGGTVAQGSERVIPLSIIDFGTCVRRFAHVRRYLNKTPPSKIEHLFKTKPWTKLGRCGKT